MNQALLNWYFFLAKLAITCQGFVRFSGNVGHHTKRELRNLGLVNGNSS